MQSPNIGLLPRQWWQLGVKTDSGMWYSNKWYVSELDVYHDHSLWVAKLILETVYFFVNILNSVISHYRVSIFNRVLPWQLLDVITGGNEALGKAKLHAVSPFCKYNYGSGIRNKGQQRLSTGLPKGITPNLAPQCTLALTLHPISVSQYPAVCPYIEEKD